MKTNLLEAVVAQEQEERAKKYNMQHHSMSRGVIGGEEMHRFMADEALKKLTSRFGNYLTSIFKDNNQRTMVAIPKLLAYHPFTGNTTIIKEAIYALSGRVSVQHYLLEELAERQYIFTEAPLLGELVDFYNGKKAITDAELFWLFMLADYLKVLTPRFEKILQARFFANNELDKHDFHHPIDSGSTEDKLSEMDTTVAEQYAAVTEMIKKLS